MSLDSVAEQLAGADPQLAQFLQAETQKQRFQVSWLSETCTTLYCYQLKKKKTLFSQGIVHSLTDQCWDICMEKPSSRLDSKTSFCITNCVDRFIDTSNFVVNRLEKTQSTFSSELDN